MLVLPRWFEIRCGTWLSQTSGQLAFYVSRDGVLEVVAPTCSNLLGIRSSSRSVKISRARQTSAPPVHGLPVDGPVTNETQAVSRRSSSSLRPYLLALRSLGVQSAFSYPGLLLALRSMMEDIRYSDPRTLRVVRGNALCAKTERRLRQHSNLLSRHVRPLHFATEGHVVADVCPASAQELGHTKEGDKDDLRTLSFGAYTNGDAPVAALASDTVRSCLPRAIVRLCALSSDDDPTVGHMPNGGDGRLTPKLGVYSFRESGSGRCRCGRWV